MKAEHKLISLHEKVLIKTENGAMASFKSGGNQIDTGEALEAIESAIESIHELKVIISTIKSLVEGVKWYEFLKLAAIIKQVVELVKAKTWDV
jgi:hypothetical protein